MVFKVLSIATGIVLILPLAFVIEQQMFVLRRSDVMSALKPLVAIPLESIRNPSSLSREVVIPSDRWWIRMTGSYGHPKILITIVNVPLGAAGHGRRTYTYEEVGVRVRLSRGASQVPLEPTNHAPYVYSSEAPNSGWLFQAEAGERLRLTVESPGFTRPLPGELVVVPDWSHEILDGLEGFAILEGVWWILVAGAGVGVAFIVFGLRRPRRTTA